MNENRLMIYSAAWCSDCQALKRWLDAKGMTYQNRDIRENREYGEQLKQVIGKEAVPYLVFEGRWIKGYQSGKVFDPAWAESLFLELGLI